MTPTVSFRSVVNAPAQTAALFFASSADPHMANRAKSSDVLGMSTSTGRYAPQGVGRSVA